MQKFPHIMMSIFMKHFDDLNMCFRKLDLPRTLLKKVRMTRLNSLDVRPLSFYEFRLHSVEMMWSTVSDSQVEIYFIATQVFAQICIFGFYYGTLIYETILDKLNARSVYKNGLMATTFKLFVAVSQQYI